MRLSIRRVEKFRDNPNVEKNGTRTTISRPIKVQSASKRSKTVIKTMSIYMETGSRKRRKVTPPNEVDDSDTRSETDTETIQQPSSTAVSRVKAKQTIQLARSTGDDMIAAAAPRNENSTFADLVSPWLVASLAAMEIKRPTGIQKGTDPRLLVRTVSRS